MSRSILFFGLPCSFADTILDAIIDSGHEIRARLIPGQPHSTEPFTKLSRSRIPVSSSTLPIARNHSPTDGIPLYRLNDHRSPSTHELLAALDAEIAIVCCYPKRIPATLMSTTRHGGLNIHPSLLPAYRGPEPLFWIYQSGERTTGVTVHQLFDRLDAGPIVRQQQIDIPIGKPGDELWADSAVIGGNLVAEILNDPHAALYETISQVETDSSYQTWPTLGDLQIIAEEWEAWRIVHFCRGVMPLGYSPVIKDGERFRQVRAVLGYSDGLTDLSACVPESARILECGTGLVAVDIDD